MIPNEEQLRAISELEEGDLAKVPFGVLLHALAASRRSVVLEIERVPLKKAIIFENGVPVDCQSNLLHETLGRFMSSRGELTPEQSQQFLGKSVASGLPFGELLIQEGVLTASQLYKLLQQNLAKKLLDGFSWRNGSFRIHEAAPEVDSPLKVNAPQLVITGISKFALTEEVNQAISPLVGTRLFLHPAPVFPLQEIRLSQGQQKVLDLVASGKRIDELAAETTVPFEQIMRLLYSLAVIGVVVPEERMPKTPVTPKSAAEPLPDTRVAPTDHPPVQDTEKESERVMTAYLQYRKQDPFDLLRVPEDASMEEIERRYLAFSRRYAPWKYEAPGLTHLVEKAEDLFFAGGRAFGELCDPERRNTLRMRRQNLRQQSVKKKPVRDRFLIRSELLDPDVQFRKGKALMAKERYQEAIQQLQFAYDCDPQNSTYRAELAYCRFRNHPEHAGEETLGELREVLRIDPRSGLGHYYQGVVLGELDRVEEAEVSLRHAIKLLKPDRRPIEALKALQSRPKKRKLPFL